MNPNRVRITSPWGSPTYYEEATTCDASAATPTSRLVSLIGSLTPEALDREGLVVLEADSPRAIWHAALNNAKHLGDASGLAQLIDVGANRGWL